MTNLTTTCPECDADIQAPTGAMQNEIIACADCGVELEIVSLSPFSVDYAPEVEEDWGE